MGAFGVGPVAVAEGWVGIVVVCAGGELGIAMVCPAGEVVVICGA